MRRSLIELAITPALLAAGLLGQAAHAEPKVGGTLTVAAYADMPTPDPAKAFVMTSHTVMKHVCEQLVALDEDYDVIPQLADSWEFSDDGKTLTFMLREGVTFHDGSILEAEDVKYSLERAAEFSPDKSQYSGIASIEAPDPRTVVIYLTDATPLIMTALATPMLGSVIPANLHKAQGGEITTPICTGPYEYVEWRPDTSLTLKRYEDYVPDERFDGPSGMGGKRTAYLDEILFKVVPDRAARVIALETGEVQYSQRLDALDMQSLEVNPDTVPVEATSLVWVHIWLNVNKPPFDNVDFRRAIAHAINYGTMLEFAADGKGTVNNAFIHPSQAAWRTPAMEELHGYDPDAAKELLEKVGYDGTPVEILSNNTLGYMSDATISLQADLRAVGINADLKLLDGSGLSGAVFTDTPEYDIAFMNSSGRYDPDGHFWRRLHSSSSINRWNYPEYDALIEQARGEMDHEKRLDLYDQAHQIIMDQVPLVIMFNPVGFEGMRTEVKGFTPSGTGIQRFWNVWLEE